MDTISRLRPWQRRQREEQIRDIALLQLKAPADDFEPFGFLEELEQLSLRKHRTVQNLEARILLCVGARIRPTRTRKALVSLRAKYAELGKADRFSEFETILKSAIGSDVVLGHGFAPVSFSSLNHEAVWEDIGKVFSRLDILGNDVFLNSGTLLGVVRDKALIAHDDDVDLAVRLPARDAREAAHQWVKLRSNLQKMGIFHEANYTDQEILKIKSDGEYHIDLFPAWVEQGQVYVYPHTAGELSEEDVFPTRPCAVSGLPIPANAGAMLALNYGPNWQTPDPYFKFPWGPAKRRFSEFRTALRKEYERARDAV